MPQNNVLPDWRATYPNDAPVQKPGGVTVSTTATAPRVPNKFTYAAGTIQMVGALSEETKEPLTEEVAAEATEDAEGNDEDEEPQRTTTTTKRTTTRTTTRRR